MPHVYLEAEETGAEPSRYGEEENKDRKNKKKRDYKELTEETQSYSGGKRKGTRESEGRGKKQVSRIGLAI